MNHKRVYRLYVDEGLQIRNKRPKRKVSAKVRSDRKPPSIPNEVWAMDFLSDQLFDGRKIRILTIVDAFSKLSPAIDVRFRYTGADVVATLNRVAGIYGVPQTIRVDNGPEFVSRSRSLGVSEWGCSGLLASRQAHRQQLRGSVQRQGPSRMH